MGRYREIPLALLDEPESPSRSYIDDAAIESLVLSIRDVGLIEPLVVKAKADGHHEVVAGHRRLLACRRAQLDPVPCVIAAKGAALDAVKLHENVDREELSVTDEALYFQRLYETMGTDTDRVSDAVKKPRAYVESRLLLLRGYDEVFQALREKKISLGVAQELNLLELATDADYYLFHCVQSGATVRQARAWREQANAIARNAAASTPAAPADGPSGPSSAPGPALVDPYMVTAKPWELSSSRELRPCLSCGRVSEEWLMFRMYCCPQCRRAYDENRKDRPQADPQVMPS